MTGFKDQGTKEQGQRKTQVIKVVLSTPRFSAFRWSLVL
jgi:hypothetical protein